MSIADADPNHSASWPVLYLTGVDLPPAPLTVLRRLRSSPGAAPGVAGAVARDCRGCIRHPCALSRCRRRHRRFGLAFVAPAMTMWASTCQPAGPNSRAMPRTEHGGTPAAAMPNGFPFRDATFDAVLLMTSSWIARLARTPCRSPAGCCAPQGAVVSAAPKFVRRARRAP